MARTRRVVIPCADARPASNAIATAARKLKRRPACAHRCAAGRLFWCSLEITYGMIFQKVKPPEKRNTLRTAVPPLAK